MDDLPVNLIIFVLVVAGAILKPVIERRKKRHLEEQKRLGNAPAAAPETAEEDGEEEPKLPYENLVDEVFGPYMERRRGSRKPAEPPAPVAEARETPREEPPVHAALDSNTESPHTKYKDEPVEAAPASLSFEERVFRNRSLSGAAKLVIAHEILQPPRMLRGRAGGLRR